MKFQVSEHKPSVEMKTQNFTVLLFSFLKSRLKSNMSHSGVAGNAASVDWSMRSCLSC